LTNSWQKLIIVYLLERAFVNMIEDEELKIRKIATAKEKELLSIALDGMYGWNFNPISVVINGIEDYYFICKVKTIIESLQMKMVKVHIEVKKDKSPKLLSIEEIA